MNKAHLLLQNQPLVSVLMTTYNRETLIRESIESVIASTYKNWELIIVDDQSTDNTVIIAKDYANKDSRIKVFINQHNLGDYPNRNKAASYANGKYLKYIDSDDLIYPFGLEQMVYYMEQYPESGFGLVARNMEQNEDLPYAIDLTTRDFYYKSYILGDEHHLCSPLFGIFRRDFFQSIGGFRNVRHYSDLEMWHRAALETKVVILPPGTIWFRQFSDENQEGQNGSYSGVNLIKRWNVTRHYTLGTKSPLTQNEKQIIKRRMNKKWRLLVLTLIKQLNFKELISYRKVYREMIF